MEIKPKVYTIEVSEQTNFLQFSVSPACQPQSVFKTQEAPTADKIRQRTDIPDPTTHTPTHTHTQNNRPQKTASSSPSPHYHAWSHLHNTFSGAPDGPSAAANTIQIQWCINIL